MQKYQLARLVEWSGELRTRKRLQKVVFLLQAAGAPIEADFTLHLYGPYSPDVAQATDEMVAAKLLDEKRQANVMAGQSFSYELSDRAREQLGQLDAQVSERAAFHRFEQVARRLLSEPSLSKLEYAATVAYFQRQGKPWAEARRAAAKFKSQHPEGETMREAEELAREVVAGADG